MNQVFLFYDHNRERLNHYAAQITIADVQRETVMQYALTRIVNTHPRVVIADWHESRGPELIVHLKNIQKRSGGSFIAPPVILMSDFIEHRDGVGISVMRHLAKEVGAAGYIPRPVPLIQEVLIDIILKLERPDPVEEVIMNIGGRQIFDQVLRRHGLRLKTPAGETLRAMLGEIGRLNSADRFAFAIQRHGGPPGDCHALVWRAFNDILLIYIEGPFAQQHLTS